jgi:porphobilinogen synthase
MTSFPFNRPRRLRKNETIRRLVRETSISPSDFIYPIFVSESIIKPEQIESMPGIFRYPVKEAALEAKRAFKLGIPGVLLFGIPAHKDAIGSQSLKDDGIVQQAIKEIKDTTPEILVIADVCFCEYTDHGHCGIIENGIVNNDATIRNLARQAISFAKAGADIVAPSDMMDGRVKSIRLGLDRNGYEDVSIMSYSAKYCSAFYGPFREAAGSAPQFGSRKNYQMDPANANEAIKEINFDINEGADIIIIKPALSYLDIVAKAKGKFNILIAAYNVSGEYSMVKLAAKAGIGNEKQLVLEILTSIKRAGADIVITYHAIDAAKWIG